MTKKETAKFIAQIIVSIASAILTAQVPRPVLAKGIPLVLFQGDSLTSQRV
jgi:hypothetical protein